MSNEKLKRTLSGKIISTKMNRTVTVLVERRLEHHLYGKYITRSKKYHAHNEIPTLNVGDNVVIEECRPISKTKNWRVIFKKKI